LNALNEKLLEEYNEYMSAKDDAERLVELADVLEVVISTARHIGMTEAELLALCHKKRGDRGAFLKGYIYEGNRK
jgi:predicted house-cleaning noncanonical NTP pyrophosphatase (MazG superfamily)